jgi:hypothetical protein
VVVQFDELRQQVRELVAEGVEIHTTNATPIRISPRGHRRRAQRGADGKNMTTDAAPQPRPKASDYFVQV